MKLFYIYKALRKIFYHIFAVCDQIRTCVIFWGNNVHHQGFKTNGVPLVSVAIGGKCTIGKSFFMNNGTKGNPIGCFQKCTISVGTNAELIIGNNVGISQTALVCQKRIIIGNDVLIGGACIYDTNFHSLNAAHRNNSSDVSAYTVKKDVIIEDRALIGAHSIIMKGVIIGKNSVVGAGSVVTKSIPPNQIWSGNPAKFIKSIY